MAACIDLVRREVADLTDKELDEVLEQMRARQTNLISGGVDPSTAAAQAGMEVAETLRAAAAIERRNALINRRIRLETLDYLQTTWADNPAEGVLALLYGSARARFGSRASANAAQSALFRRYIGGVQGELEAAGLFDVLRRGELDRDVFRAMRSINDESALKQLPEQAVEIAKILDRWQEVARIEANRAGAWIGKLDDYGLRQSHNADRIMRAGEAKWKADILPKLDLARMFPDGPPKDMDQWLHETFLNIVTGVRDADPTASKMAAFKGPGNLAKKASQERTLIFRNADDAFDYNTNYGMGNIRETFVTGMHRMAESTGLMQTLGTNPEYNLNAVVDAVRARLSRSDPAALKKFDDATRKGVRIQNAYREVSGQTRMAASTRLAAVGQGVRVWNTLTGLGGAVISAVTDVPVRASLLRYQGQSFLKQIGKGLIDPLTRLADSLDSADRKAVLAASGYFNEIALGNLAARFSPDDNVPGILNRATNTFFKWNLLAQWTDSMRRSTLEAMSHYWGSVADLSWAKLSDRNRMALERFRIGEQEWSVISKGTTEADGQRFMTPQAVRELHPNEFAPLAKDRINALKTGLAERIQRRLKQDQRELEWVSNRSEKLRSALLDARTRLQKRIEQADAKLGGRLKELDARLSKMDESIDFAEGYWQQRVSRSEKVGFYGKRALRDAGISEGRAREASKTIGAESRQIARDLAALKKELNEDFIDKWTERQDDLVAFSEGVDERISKRAEQTAKELADLQPKIDRILDDTRSQIADRLQQFYADDLDSAVISPDARTLSFIRQGQQAGTPIGEALRLFWQFKSFGIAIMQRAFLREFHGYGPKLGISQVKGLGLLMLGSLSFGYAAMTLKDLVKGKKPRPINNPKTWTAAMAQGGGMGIYGDFLFGESSRLGGGFLETLGGPTVGKAADAKRLFDSAKYGEDFGAQGLRFLVSNTPGNNLFYTRMAADYLFLYELQEAMNPGYLRRMERRAEQERGQEWWLRPSEVVN
jgi:hypothetical protein